MKRDCFTCGHYRLCFLRHRIDKALEMNRLLNIDGDDAPGRMIDIFEAVGRACMVYVKKGEIKNG